MDLAARRRRVHRAGRPHAHRLSTAARHHVDQRLRRDDGRGRQVLLRALDQPGAGGDRLPGIRAVLGGDGHGQVFGRHRDQVAGGEPVDQYPAPRHVVHRLQEGVGGAQRLDDVARQRYSLLQRPLQAEGVDTPEQDRARAQRSVERSGSLFRQCRVYSHRGREYRRDRLPGRRAGHRLGLGRLGRRLRRQSAAEHRCPRQAHHGIHLGRHQRRPRAVRRYQGAQGGAPRDQCARDHRRGLFRA